MLRPTRCGLIGAFQRRLNEEVGEKNGFESEKNNVLDQFRLAMLPSELTFLQPSYPQCFRFESRRCYIAIFHTWPISTLTSDSQNKGLPLRRTGASNRCAFYFNYICYLKILI